MAAGRREMAGEQARRRPVEGASAGGRSATTEAVVARVAALEDRPGAVSSEAELDRLLEEVVRAVGCGLGWTVAVCVGRPGEDALTARAAHGLDPHRWAALRGIAFTRAQWEPLLAARFARGGAFLVPEGALRPTRPPPASADPAAWREGDDLFLPFRGLDGRVLGVISLEAPVSGRRPMDAELKGLVAVAEHTGRLVRRAHEAMAAARQATVLTGLLRATAELTATRAPDAVAHLITGALADHLGFGRVIVEVVGADGLLRPVAGRGEIPSGLEPLSGAELAGLDVEKRGSLLVEPERAATVLPAARRLLQHPSVGALDPQAWDEHLLLVPLREHDGRVVGLAWLDAPHDGLLPPPQTVEALESFAAQAAAALTSAQAHAGLAQRGGRDERAQLPNRAAFTEELGREVARTNRTGQASMLVLATVEGRSAPGEGTVEEGHQEVLGALRSELRLDDRVFRIDGGLFAILLVGTDRPPETKAVTLRIAARLGSIGRGRGAVVCFGTAAIGAQSGSAAEVLGRARRQLLDRRRALS